MAALAVTVGRALRRVIPPRRVQQLAAVLPLVLSVVSLVNALR